MKNSEQIVQKVKDLNLKIFEVIEVMACNFKPHPYVITPSHLAKNDSPFLDERSIAEAERNGAHCGHTDRNRHVDCWLPYDQHTYQNALLLKPSYDFLKVARENNNKIPDDANQELVMIKNCITENKFHIDGFAFAKSNMENIT